MAKAKIVDVWKSKTWYTVLAPQIFENKEIGQIPATEDSKLLNRVVEVSLSDLTGDISHSYVSLKFKVNDVKGKTAYTTFVGHEISPSYLKTLVRRRRDVVGEVVDVETKDGVKMRLKLQIFTAKRVSSSARTDLRKNSREEMINRAKELDSQQLIQEIVFGKFSAHLFNKLKKICPIKRIEVRKTEIAGSTAS
ncbi:MAG: 30S ribosomal protein S3ae [Candidatus Micrarchaeia archaeon]